MSRDGQAGLGGTAGSGSLRQYEQQKGTDPAPREPAFTETLQIGIVVRDLDATMRSYVDNYGIGPWDIYEFNPGNLKDFHEYGQPGASPPPWSDSCNGS